MDFLRQTGLSHWNPLPVLNQNYIKKVVSGGPDEESPLIRENEILVKPDALSGPGPRFLPPVRDVTREDRETWVSLEGNGWDKFGVVLRFGVPAIYVSFDDDTGQIHPAPAYTYPLGRLGPGSDEGIYVPSHLAGKYRENKDLYVKRLGWHLQEMAMEPKETLLDEATDELVTVEDWHWDRDSGTFSLTVKEHTTGELALRENLVWFISTIQSPPTPILSYKKSYGNANYNYFDLVKTEMVISNAASDAFQSRKRGADDDLDPGAALPTKMSRW